jgi:hypothetical protein
MLKQLQKKRKSLLKTLDDVDQNLLKGKISETTYKDLKKKYTNKLNTIDLEIIKIKKESKKKRKLKRKVKGTKKAQKVRDNSRLETFQFRRNYIQKMVEVLENKEKSLDQCIIDLLTVKSQMGKKLSSSEIIRELKFFSADNVRDELNNLLNNQKILATKSYNHILMYYIDMSWKVDGLTF